MTAHPWSAWQKIAGGAGAIGIAAALAGAFMATEAFFQAYLYGYLFWLGLSLGAMAVLMIHHLMGGAWGFVIQRSLEAAVSTIPLMAILFIPLLFGLHDLYHWSHAEAVAADPILAHKAPYLNTPGFIIRAVVYFVLWTAMAFMLVGWSHRQQKSGEAGLTNRLKTLSGPGLVLYVLSTTFASIDWAMSKDPHWFSTIYGLVFAVAQGLSIFAFMSLLLPMLKRDPELGPAATPDRLHDIGKLLFAFVMLWGYINVSQFLIIWMGNVPEETPWYLHRTQRGWEVLAGLVILTQFALPFLLLMTRHTKRHFKALAAVALLILVGRFFDLFWLVRPSAHHLELHVHWLDLALPIALGGIWLTFFFWRLGRQPLLPTRDPRLEETLAAHGGH